MTDSDSDATEINPLSDVEHIEEEADEEEEEEEDEEQKISDQNQGKFKYGIIYLSYIPDGLNIKLLREIMGQFGLVGRVYLQPESTTKKHRTYSEGWIEFKKKRDAKLVAKTLNGTPLQYGRKRCKMNGQIWSIKYLHRFKWSNLLEQLSFDRATRDQRRQFHLEQTKKNVDFYQRMIHKSKRLQRVQKLDDVQEPATDKAPDEKIERKNRRKRDSKPFRKTDPTATLDEDFLSSIFKNAT